MEELTIQERLVGRLKELNLKISFAESCTGGLAAAGIVDVSGASEIFYGSVVTYDNSIKADLIGVSWDVLNSVGPVSHECAKQMASGVRNKIGSDIALSLTGIAGPGGAEPGKPVGTVYIGYADKSHIDSIVVHLNGNRTEVRKQAVIKCYEYALSKLNS